VANSNPGPEIVFFITDGQPNRYLDANGTVQEGTEAEAVAEAEVVANQLNATGTRVIAIGVGDLNNSTTAASNLARIASDGNNSTVVSMDQLNNVISQYAYKACPTVSLVKSSKTVYIREDTNMTSPVFSLHLHNSSLIELNHIVVEDALPVESMTFNSFLSTPPSTTASVSNDVITWSIDHMDPGESLWLSFDINVSSNLAMSTKVYNYAQVKSLDENVNSTPNSFEDPITGPVDLSERDESRGYLELRNWVDPTCHATVANPHRCLRIYKNIAVGEGNCATGKQCAYQLIIRNTSPTPYTGTLNISDNFDKGGPVNITRITLASGSSSGAPATICDGSNPTGIPFNCQQTTDIPGGHTWRYDVVLDNTPANATQNIFNVNGITRIMPLP